MSKILFSSISKKFVMALAGLFLLTFLPVHLTINLFLLKDDPEPFNTAAHFMATFPVIKIIEIVLIGSILIHIIWGIMLQIQNWFARPVGYVSGIKSETSFFSRFMIWTGATIFIFLIIHFFNFYFVKLGLVKGNPEDFYSMAHSLFQDPVIQLYLPYLFYDSRISPVPCLFIRFSDTWTESQDLDSCSQSCCTYIFNCDSFIFCFYFNLIMAFQVVLENNNNNHGKTKFKDT